MSLSILVSALRAVPQLLSWEHARRIYVWAMTLNMQGLLRYHAKDLFSPDAMEKNGWTFDQEKIFQLSTLLQLDEAYTVKRAGFESIRDYYHWCSCSHRLDNVSLI